MAFFLLGRVDDTLTLLSPDTFASRQDAMGALSLITAEPGFLMWDAEVLILDTDSGNPVLLMRPAVATEPAPVVEALVSDVAADTVLVADVGEEPLETVVVEEPPVDVRSLVEPVVIDDELEEPLEEPELLTADEPMIESVTDPAIADAIIEEQAAETTEVDEPEPVSLKDALARTAAHMEAEGIVAPESITSPEQDAPAPESAWPWDTSADAPEGSPDKEPEFVLSELEEPSLDDRSILHSTIDDEMFAAARPVIMGAYAEPAGGLDGPAHDELDGEPVGSLLDDLVLDPLGLLSPTAPTRSGFAIPVVGDAGDIFPLEPSSMPESVADMGGDVTADSIEQPDAPQVDVPDEAPDEAADAQTDSTPEASDFILDLDQIEASVADSPVVTDLDDYTCKDCVYEETCPNKDQRLPKDCGSFQWR